MSEKREQQTLLLEPGTLLDFGGGNLAVNLGPKPPTRRQVFALILAGILRSGDQGHGHLDGEAATTDRSPARLSDFVDHLDGKRGLGSVPLRPDGTCRFGAIDVDDPATDHAALAKKVAERQLPLTVCRSKSGGAHLYVFFYEPGAPAAEARALLRHYAALLGYPGAEVFPKQDQIREGEVGNWINLPYFAAGQTTRYAVGPDGRAWTLQEFLTGVRFLDPAQLPEIGGSAPLPVAGDIPQKIAPPLPETLAEGQRNTLLFSLACSMRRRGASVEAIRAALREENQRRCRPPLDEAEIERTILKSVGRYEAGAAPGAADELILGRLRKYKSEPPVYLLEVNRAHLRLTGEELLSPRRFKQRVFEATNIVVRNLGQRALDQWLRELMNSVEEVEVPDNVSLSGHLTELLGEFLAARRGAVVWEDIEKGLPFESEGRVFFRASDLKKFLDVRRFAYLSVPEVFAILHGRGLETDSRAIRGRQVALWACPADRLNEQTEEFTPARFDAEKKEDEL